VILPSVVVDQERSRRRLRLPLQLSAWALDVAALGLAGHFTFPTDIEFGILDGRAYAEFVM
jgi:hypothetical protein